MTTLIKKTLTEGTSLQFRGSVHPGREHGSIQADVVLKLRVSYIFIGSRRSTDCHTE